MAQNLAQVKHYFQQRADKFDAIYREERKWRYYLDRRLRPGLFERAQLALGALEGLQNFSVLDVGCGSGRISALFAEAGAQRVLGIDFSQPMLDLAVSFCQARGVASQCEFITGDFLAYSCEEKFDAVIALGVFDYVSEPRPFLQKMLMSANTQIIASFPGQSLFRAPARKMRYKLRGCPLYFYTAKKLDHICHDIGLTQYRLVPYASSGFLLVGKVESK